MATFTFNISANVPPTVSAGTDKNIQAPSSVVLDGTASDADNGIALIEWRRVNAQGTPISLPPGAFFDDPNILTPTVSGLSFGNYIFRLSVTDNSGVTVTDTMTVDVADSPTISSISPPTPASTDTEFTLEMTITDEDGVELLEILNPGDTNSQTKYPSGANPTLTPQSLPLAPPYNNQEVMSTVVSNATELGLYVFTYKYKGVGGNNTLRHVNVVKNTATQNTPHVLQVTDCAETSNGNSSSAVSYYGQDIQDGTVLYFGNIENENPFNGGDNTYRGMATAYTPNDSFSNYIITSYTFQVDTNGVVYNVINCP